MLTPSYCWSQGQITRPSQNPNKNSTLTPVVSDPDGYINGHGFIDLGLPSGIKWATTNLGASKPFEPGGYFFWGESENVNFGKVAKDLKELKIIDDKGKILPDKDRVIKVWGKEWQTPSQEEYEELLKYCKWEIKKIHGTRGYLVTGPNKKSIFLPFSGWIRNEEPNKEVYEKNNEGYYLTNTYNLQGSVSDYYDTCYVLTIFGWQGYYPSVSKLQRATQGFSIRPVLTSPK